MDGNRVAIFSPEPRSSTNGILPKVGDNYDLGGRYSSNGPCGFSNTWAEMM